MWLLPRLETEAAPTLFQHYHSYPIHLQFPLSHQNPPVVLAYHNINKITNTHTFLPAMHSSAHHEAWSPGKFWLTPSMAMRYGGRGAFTPISAHNIHSAASKHSFTPYTHNFLPEMHSPAHHEARCSRKITADPKHGNEVWGRGTFSPRFRTQHSLCRL